MRRGEEKELKASKEAPTFQPPKGFIPPETRIQITPGPWAWFIVGTIFSFITLLVAIIILFNSTQLDEKRWLILSLLLSISTAFFGGFFSGKIYTQISGEHREGKAKAIAIATGGSAIWLITFLALTLIGNGILKV